LLDAPELKTFGENAIATLASVSNILVWLKVNYFAPGASQNPLLMTWSLGVEEQFYLVFPVIMILCARMGRRKLLAGTLIVTVLSLTLSVLVVMKHRNAAFYLLPTRAWELSIGVLLAIYENEQPLNKLYRARQFANWLGLLGLGLLTYPIVGYSDTTPFPGMAAIMPALGSALILMSTGGWVNRYLLSTRLFVFVGLVSYSWYLWHWPLLSFARIVSDRAITKTEASTVAAVSLLVAWCSYMFVEQPFRKSQTPTGLLLRKYAVLCVLMMLPGLALVAGKGFPQRCPELSAVEHRSGVQLSDDTCLVEYGVSLPNLSKHCVPVQDERPGVALLGDSHAGALGDALRELAQTQNMKVYEMTKGSCPPLVGVTRRMSNHPGHDYECARFNQEAMEIVRRDPRIETVLLAGYWSAPFVEESQGSRFAPNGDGSPVSPTESSANLEHGLNAAIAELKASGKRVVVLNDVPVFNFDPVRRVRSEFIPLRGFLAREFGEGGSEIGSVPRSVVDTPEDLRASSIVDRAAGSSAEVIGLKQNLCNDWFCDFYADGLLLYADPQHLSLAGSRRALEGIRLQ
jgi:peptidoglycan/LPS O-acetylase OafA/YrhL